MRRADARVGVLTGARTHRLARPAGLVLVAFGLVEGAPAGPGHARHPVLERSALARQELVFVRALEEQRSPLWALARTHPRHRLRALSWLLALAVAGFCSSAGLYRGMHWPTDVAASVVFPVTWLLLLCAILLRPRAGAPPDC